MTRQLTPRTAAAVLALALASLTACGNDSSADAGTDDEVASLSADRTDDTTTDGTGAEDSDRDPEEAMLEFAECMREQGVDMPDPKFTDDGGVTMEVVEGEDGTSDPQLPDMDTMDDAFAECEHLMESVEAARGDFDPTEMQDEMLEFAQCMRDEGIDMPDPDFSDTGPVETESTVADSSGHGAVIAGPFGTLDLGDDEVAAAFEECQGVMGGPDMAVPAVPNESSGE